jgi:predicted transcriptional regulator
MKVLWRQGDSTVAQVLEHLSPANDLAYTTVATMLRKMESRGLVRHRAEGRTFIYQARLAEQAVTRSMANHLVDRLFAGSLTDAVHHLLSHRDVSADELAQLERLIARRKKEL